MRYFKKQICFTQNVYSTNLQFIFIKNFNQINRKQFRESLKEKKKSTFNTFFLERDKFYRINKLILASQEKYIVH